MSQTLGHIYLLDREGNELECVNVLFRLSKHNFSIKLRKSKDHGTHLKSEQIYIQNRRFGGSYIPQISEEDAEALYQEYITSLKAGETVGG